MNSASSISIADLRSAILRDVSRSFYLSIRLLPARLRDPIALAYLLARATDTIADTAEIEAGVRLERLRELAALIQNGGNADAVVSFSALQKDAGERALIERLPACLEWLDALPTEDQRDIRQVLAKINEGQALDVQRFCHPTEIVALETAADLDRYTYLVAGCVGEFWTHVCFRHLPKFTAQAPEQMMQWGTDYGKGLQLVNILRDAGQDLRTGRCYLPAEELATVGLTLADLRRSPVSVESVLRAWRARAERGMAAGVEYACAIESWRVRLATALPALIGARTLVLLREAGPAVLEQRVKMERAEVRRILFALGGRLAAPAAIRALFARLSS